MSTFEHMQELSRLPVLEIHELLKAGELSVYEDPEQVIGEQLNCREAVRTSLQDINLIKAYEVKADIFWQIYRSEHHAMIWSKRGEVSNELSGKYPEGLIDLGALWELLNELVLHYSEEWGKEDNQFLDRTAAINCEEGVEAGAYSLVQPLSHLDKRVEQINAHLIRNTDMTRQAYIDYLLIELSEHYLAQHVVQSYEASVDVNNVWS